MSTQSLSGADPSEMLRFLLEVERKICSCAYRANLVKTAGVSNERRMLMSLADNIDELVKKGPACVRCRYKVTQYSLAILVGLPSRRPENGGGDVLKAFNSANARVTNILKCKVGSLQDHRKLFRAKVACALLGDPNRQEQMNSAPVDRMLDYLLGPEKNMTGPYFDPAAISSEQDARTPRRPEEAAYEVLWLADMCQRYSREGYFWVASGGSGFAQGIAGELSAEVTLTAAIAGVKVILVCPQLCASSETDAEHSATKFFSWAASCLSKGSLPGFAAGFTTQDDIKTIAERIQMWKVFPTEMLGPSSTIWAGQFFNPVFRYVLLDANPSYTDGGTQDKMFFISREKATYPFAFSTSPAEERAFGEWLAAVKQHQNAKKMTLAQFMNGASTAEVAPHKSTRGRLKSR